MAFLLNMTATHVPYHYNLYMTIVADLHRQISDTPPLPPNFLHFHSVSGKFGPNNRLVPLWEILDLPLVSETARYVHCVRPQLSLRAVKTIT